MKKYFMGFFSIMLFLSGCVRSPSAADTTQASITATPIIPIATDTIVPPTTVTAHVFTITTSPSTPTFLSISLPADLVVAYVVEDELWIWKQNRAQLLTQRQNISVPLISDDGQWILFKQRHNSPDGSTPPSDELWTIQMDKSELQRLVGSDDLKELAGEEGSFLIDDIGWLPGHNEILFNTDTIVEGPPGSWPSFDLYSLDLSGQVGQLAKPGQGGKFTPSPDGSRVALATNSRIRLLDLETGEQSTLLEFKPVGAGSDYLFVPEIVWEP